jgi:beta-lactamase regulating signal transducer with metallopeptidase domain
MPFWTVAVPWSGWFAADEAEQTPPLPVQPGEACDHELVGPTPAAGPLPADSDARAVPKAEPHWLSRIGWPAWLLIAWAAIVCVHVLRIAFQRRRLNRLLRSSRPAAGDLANHVADVARELKLARIPAIRLTDVDCSPFVCGVRRPVLVLPERVVGTLTAGELRHVLFHELAHVKRRDLLWGWIPEIARMAYFFHPIAHWMIYRLNLERELACDQIAMKHTGHDAAAYARTLVRVVSRQSDPLMLKAAAAGCVPSEETLR